MKITMYIIRDFLGEEVIKEQISANRSVGLLEAVSIFSPELATHPDRVYIVENRYLSSFKAAQYEGAFIFLSGTEEELLSGVQNDYLSLRENHAVLVLQKLQMLFVQYHNWEVALYKAAAHKNGIKNIAITATALIENPFFLYTSSLKLVFCCNLTEKAESFFQSLEDYDDQIEGEYVTNSFLDRLRDDPERCQTIMKRGPEISSNENLGYRTLYYNIYLGGIYAARLLICEAGQEIKDGDFFVLKTLGDFLTPFLGKQDMAVNVHPVNFDKYLHKLLAGENVDESALKPVLETFGWHGEDRYFCCYIPVDTEALATDIVMSTCVFLEATCPSSALITYDDHIVHVINLTAMWDRKERVQQTLVRLYRERRLKAGSSPEFEGIRQLADRYNQAEAAYRLGHVSDQQETYFMYEDYKLKDLLRTITARYSLEAICPEEIRKLQEYDETKNMHLTRTLKTYLKNDRNIAKSIRVLYMQRATFLYQLNRIMEITGVDLDDYPSRLHLQLYFAAEEAVGL